MGLEIFIHFWHSMCDNLLLHCITSDNDAGLFNSSLCFICFIQYRLIGSLLTDLMFLRLLLLEFFDEQIQCMEESAESLRERSLKFYKGCRKYTYVFFSSLNLMSLVFVEGSLLYKLQFIYAFICLYFLTLMSFSLLISSSSVLLQLFHLLISWLVFVICFLRDQMKSA